MAANLSWQVPQTTTDNTFSVTLVSDQALTGVSLDDFTFRREDGVFIEASTVATLTQVTGTNNWRLDATLTGTVDHDFQVRLRSNRLTGEDSDPVPSSNLTSDNFHVNSSSTAPDAPSLSITPSETSAAAILVAPTDDGDSDITDHEYAIEQGDSLSANPTWHSTGSTSTSFTIPNLMPATQYTAAARSVNINGVSDASTSVTFTTSGYQVQIYDKNYKTDRGDDGTLAGALGQATSISIQHGIESSTRINFEVPRNTTDAGHLEIGRVVRVVDGSDIQASGIIIGPLDKTRPMIPVIALDKSEILNHSITPYEFELEGDTAEAQIRELLKNYRFFRQNTPAEFNAGTLTDTEVLTVAGTGDAGDTYFVTLTETNEVYAASGTYISEPILATHDILGDPDDITRLRYRAELGNDTEITAAFRYSNNAANDEPDADSDWSSWSTEYDLTTENTEKLGLTDYAISADFRWIQVRFSLSTSDTSITPALEAFEIICEYPGEISAGSIDLPGGKLRKAFSFDSHLDAIRQIVAARDGEMRVNDDYELNIAKRFGITAPTETFEVGVNCNVIRYQQNDRNLSTEMWAFGREGEGIAKTFQSSVDDSAIEDYGTRPWLYTPIATGASEKTQEISDELDLRKQPAIEVVIDELAATPPSVAIGDIVNFEYDARGINTTLRIIGIHVGDPRSGRPRQFTLLSDEGFFATEPEPEPEDAVSGATGAIDDDDLIDWNPIPPQPVFTDADGNFTGELIADIDDYLHNPSGVDITYAIADKSTSIASATLDADNDVNIAVTGLTANVFTAFVEVSATGTINGVSRTVTGRIDVRLIFLGGVDTSDFVTSGDLPDTSGFLTSGDIADFVTAGVTDGLATDADLQSATSGLATDSELTAATQGLVTAGVTDGLATDSELTAATQGLATDADLQSATSGLATDSELTAATQGLVTAGVTDGLATDSELTAATQGLATDADLQSATSGLATDSELTAATQGLVTAGVTAGLATDAELTAATQGLVTAGVTAGLATDSELTAATQGLVTAGVTAGLATDSDLQSATSGLATDADLTAATQGLATDAELTAATQGLVTAGVTAGLATDSELTAATQGLATDADLQSATSGLATDSELTAATQGLVTAGVTSGLATEADLQAAESDITNISGLVDTNISNISGISGIVDTNISNISGISGIVDTNISNISGISGIVDTNISNISGISGIVDTNTSNISGISGIVDANVSNISGISGIVDANTSNISGISTTVSSLSGDLEENPPLDFERLADTINNNSDYINITPDYDNQKLTVETTEELASVLSGIIQDISGLSGMIDS